MRMACGQPSAACAVHGDHGGGAAKRRRDRRLRMHWRHEQLTLQMALAAALHHSGDVGTCNALRSQKTARAEATNNALRSWKTSVAGDTEFFSLYEEDLGGTRPDASLASGRRRGFCGALWSRSSTQCRWSRCSTTLSRRWWNSWWTCSLLSISALPSRLSKCPRSCVHAALLAQSSMCRRWRNSWWKCPRSCPSFLFSSRLRSKSLTFRFLIAVVVASRFTPRTEFNSICFCGTHF